MELEDYGYKFGLTGKRQARIVNLNICLMRFFTVVKSPTAFLNKKGKKCIIEQIPATSENRSGQD